MLSFIKRRVRVSSPNYGGDFLFASFLNWASACSCVIFVGVLVNSMVVDALACCKKSAVIILQRFLNFMSFECSLLFLVLSYTLNTLVN